MVEMKIQNVVTSVELKMELPLGKIAESFEHAEYEPEQFPGLVFRSEGSKVTCLIFRSGKIICVGGKTLAEARDGIKKVLQNLRKVGIKIPKNYEIKIENVVATANLKRELNLEDIAFAMEESEYEPEQFPGLIVRLQKPKVAFLVFSSGSLVCAGAKTEEEAKKGIETLLRKLKKVGAI